MKYVEYLKDVRKIDLIQPTNRNNVIKSLIVLSKFLGIHEQFKATLRNYGVKVHKQNGIESFIRILNASNSDILQWFNTALEVSRDNEKTYLRFVKATGVRMNEAIMAFNLIIQLSKEGKLTQYYDENLNCLMHFKYKQFLRNTKNVYVSFVPKQLINEIANSDLLTYAMMHKRFQIHNVRLRINELRDYFGTYMRKHSIDKEEVDLLQGRIPAEVFVRHYWSPRLAELRDRIFKALEVMP